MNARRSGFWHTLAQHPVYVVLGLVGSLCSIASIASPAIGIAPPAVALVGVAIVVVLLGVGYSLLRQPSIDASQTYQWPAGWRRIGPIEPDENLHPYDAMNAVSDVDSKDLPLYREATNRLQNGEIPGMADPATGRAIAEAIYRWVARTHRLLLVSYPGNVNTPQKKEQSLNSLHRAAYRWMHTGRVIRFGDDTVLRSICLEIVRQVDRWVELELIERQ